jgi:hypothetical protein
LLIKLKIMKTKSLLLLLLLAIVYGCSDDAAPPNTGTDIIGFDLTQAAGPAIIDNTAHTVYIEVVSGTDRSAVAPVFSLSTGAIAVPASGTVFDYTNQVTINVTAQDGVTKQAWQVNVAAETIIPGPTDILAFTLPEQTALASINNTSNTVAIEVANGTNLTSLTPEIVVSAGATSAPSSGTAGNYSSAVTIVVTAADGITTENWSVNVTAASAGGTGEGTDILTFTVPSQEMAALIDPDQHLVAVKVVAGTDLSTITPTFTLSPGATSFPVTGTLQDYSDAKAILVNAEDGKGQQVWVVKIFSSFDAASICDAGNCADDPDAAQQCITIFEDCMASYGDVAFVPCALVALGACDD